MGNNVDKIMDNQDERKPSGHGRFLGILSFYVNVQHGFVYCLQLCEQVFPNYPVKLCLRSLYHHFQCFIFQDNFLDPYKGLLRS